MPVPLAAGIASQTRLSVASVMHAYLVQSLSTPQLFLLSSAVRQPRPGPQFPTPSPLRVHLEPCTVPMEGPRCTRPRAKARAAAKAARGLATVTKAVTVPGTGLVETPDGLRRTGQQRRGGLGTTSRGPRNGPDGPTSIRHGTNPLLRHRTPGSTTPTPGRPMIPPTKFSGRLKAPGCLVETPEARRIAATLGGAEGAHDPTPGALAAPAGAEQDRAADGLGHPDIPCGPTVGRSMPPINGFPST